MRNLADPTIGGFSYIKGAHEIYSINSRPEIDTRRYEEVYIGVGGNVCGETTKLEILDSIPRTINFPFSKLGSMSE